MQNIVKKVEQKGDLVPLKQGYSWRQRSVRSGKNIQHIAESINCKLRLSCRRRSQELGMMQSSVLRIQEEGLKLTPHLLLIKQALSPHDITANANMARCFSEKMQHNEGWIKHVWFSGEAHFHLHGNTNKCSNVYWDLKTNMMLSIRHQCAALKSQCDGAYWPALLSKDHISSKITKEKLQQWTKLLTKNCTNKGRSSLRRKGVDLINRMVPKWWCDTW